nr:hypothetical protein [Tanacetum cinerariifolium]
METTIEQQAAMDEAFVPHAQRDILHICLRVHGQSFDEPPFEEEILSFIHFLGHSAAIRTLTDLKTISSSDLVGVIPQEETVTLKRRRDDDADKDEEPSAGPDRGSKRRREGKEPESASAPMETATKSAGRSTQGSRSRQVSASESALVEEPMQTTLQMEEPSHLEFDTGAEDQPIAQSSQHPEWFSQPQKPPSLDRD